jgi:hypothetical protein
MEYRVEFLTEAERRDPSAALVRQPFGPWPLVRPDPGTELSLASCVGKADMVVLVRDAHDRLLGFALGAADPGEGEQSSICALAGHASDARPARNAGMLAAAILQSELLLELAPLQRSTRSLTFATRGSEDSGWVEQLQLGIAGEHGGPPLPEQPPQVRRVRSAELWREYTGATASAGAGVGDFAATASAALFSRGRPPDCLYLWLSVHGAPIPSPAARAVSMPEHPA